MFDTEGSLPERKKSPTLGIPYFIAFDEHWNKIARKLSLQRGQRMRARRNHRLECVEFRIGRSGDTIAFAIVEGECCTPMLARIMSKFSSAEQHIFEDVLPIPTRFERL